MKKVILVLLVIFSLFIFTVPAYAETCDDCKKTFCETCGQELPENEICETCGQEIKEENIETKPIEIRKCKDCGIALLDGERSLCEDCDFNVFNGISSDSDKIFIIIFLLGLMYILSSLPLYRY